MRRYIELSTIVLIGVTFFVIGVLQNQKDIEAQFFTNGYIVGYNKCLVVLKRQFLIPQDFEHITKDDF